MSRTRRRRKPRKPPGTIREVPEPPRQRIEPILREFWPKRPTGRRPANGRQVLNGITFRMRSGCQWDQLPRRFGPESTVHGRSQRWAEGGIFAKIWAVLAANTPGRIRRKALEFLHLCESKDFQMKVLDCPFRID